MQIIYLKYNNHNCLLNYNVNITVCRLTITIPIVKKRAYKWFSKSLEVHNVSSKFNVIRKVDPCR